MRLFFEHIKTNRREGGWFLPKTISSLAFHFGEIDIEAFVHLGG